MHHKQCEKMRSNFINFFFAMSLVWCYCYYCFFIKGKYCAKYEERFREIRNRLIHFEIEKEDIFLLSSISRRADLSNIGETADVWQVRCIKMECTKVLSSRLLKNSIWNAFKRHTKMVSQFYTLVRLCCMKWKRARITDKIIEN